MGSLLLLAIGSSINVNAQTSTIAPATGVPGKVISMEPTTADEIKTFLQGGRWVSITPEVRPGGSKSTDGTIQPTYCLREFVYLPDDRFVCKFTTYADPNAKVPLIRFVIKGHLKWEGDHPIARGAQKVDYVADESYEATPMIQAVADALNKAPVDGVNKWEVNVMQDLKGKAFPAFGLLEPKTYVDYDLIYIHYGMLFNGSKNVDGRPFNKPENRPTNLQIPLERQPG